LDKLVEKAQTIGDASAAVRRGTDQRSS